MSRGIRFGVDADVSADAEANSTGAALLDVLGKIHFGITDLKSAVERQYTLEQKRLANVPVNIPLAAVSAPLGTTDIQDLGGPSSGREWIVRLLSATPSPLAFSSTGVGSSTVGANPPAGSEVLVTVPAGQQWTISSIDFTLVTSAVVANRTVTLIIDDGGNTVFKKTATVNQTASQTVEYAYGVSNSDSAAVVNGVLSLGLAPITLGPGFRIRTVTTNLDVGDDYGNPKVSFTRTNVNTAVVTWYVGQVMPGPAAGQLPLTMSRWQFTTIPAFQVFTSDVIRVRSGEHLIAGLTSVPAGSIIDLTGMINDQALYSGVQVR